MIIQARMSRTQGMVKCVLDTIRQYSTGQWDIFPAYSTNMGCVIFSLLSTGEPKITVLRQDPCLSTSATVWVKHEHKA